MFLTRPELSQPAIWALLAAIWTGVSLSGNLIAAPAKFQVQALDLPTALQVGRAQFTWIGRVEWAILALMLVVLVAHLRSPPLLLSATAVIFVLQQLWLQPLLRARSDMIIAGQTPGSGHVHFLFAGLESIKCLLLLFYAGLTIVSLMRALEQTSPT